MTLNIRSLVKKNRFFAALSLFVLLLRVWRPEMRQAWRRFVHHKRYYHDYVQECYALDGRGREGVGHLIERDVMVVHVPPLGENYQISELGQRIVTAALVFAGMLKKRLPLFFPAGGSTGRPGLDGTVYAAFAEHLEQAAVSKVQILAGDDDAAESKLGEIGVVRYFSYRRDWKTVVAVAPTSQLSRLARLWRQSQTAARSLNVVFLGVEVSRRVWLTDYFVLVLEEIFPRDLERRKYMLALLTALFRL